MSIINPNANLGIVDINLIQRLTNLSEINRILHETLAKERSVENDLEKLLCKRVDLERSFLLLNTPTAEALELVHADCEQLLSNVQSTAQLAEGISSKVRRLDMVQGRVQETLDKITLILDRSNCIEGVQAAMNSEDYEAAASHIKRFLDLEQQLSSSSFGGDLARAEEQSKVLRAAKGSLERVVEERFSEAAARRDVEAVVRFARLHVPLGLEARGLARFVEFLCVSVASAARLAYTTLADALDSGKSVDFQGALVMLFKDVGLTLERHEATIRDVFGSNAVLELLGGLAKEVDTCGARLLQRFTETRRLDVMAREVGGRKRPVGTGPEAAHGVEHRTVEALISEVLAICRSCEEYNQYMLGKMRDSLPGGTMSAARETSFRSGQFNVCVRELLGYYTALEEFYLNETIAVAIRIDELPSGSMTSSLVDDAFFILRKVCRRALSSANLQVASALLSEAAHVMTATLVGALGGKTAAGPTKMLVALGVGEATGANAAAPPTAASTHLPDFAVGLNNADTAADYTARLRAELESLAAGLFPVHHERERLSSVLADLGRAGGELRSVAGRGLDALADALLPRLRTVLEEALAVSYSLNEAAYAALEMEEGWAARMVAGVSALMAPLTGVLAPPNWEGALAALTDKIVLRLEAGLQRKSFNQLGGLALDRDVRTLVNALSDMTSRTIRDKFARLTQMALVLGLESVSELLDYWGDDADASVSWRLSAAEVRAVLCQRSDFAKEAVMALPL